MENKTALITGGTSGIGLSLVEQLVKLQYNVCFIGTNPEKGNAIEQRLALQTDKKVTFILLDLSNLKAVYKFSQEFIQSHAQLDLLANIAGVLLPKRTETEEGLEMNFALSYLSAYILSTELLPLFQQSPHPRIVNVSAKPNIVIQEMLNFDDLGFSLHYNPFKASSRAVHAKTVLTHILSEKFAQFNLTVNAFDPGIVSTNLMRNMPAITRLITSLFFVFAPKKSRTAIFACTAEALNGVTGKLFTQKKSVDLAFSHSYKTKLLSHTADILSSLSQPRKPNYSIEWIVPKKLVGLTHFHAEVTQEDIQGVFETTEKVLEPADQAFSFIIDNRRMLMDKLYSLTQLQRQSRFLKHKYLKYIVVIIPSHLKISPSDSEIQHIDGISLKNVSTVSEAYAFLCATHFIQHEELIGQDFIRD